MSRKSSRRLILAWVAAAVCVGMLVSTERVSTQGRPAWPPVLRSAPAGEVDTLHVQGNVYMLSGAGANITVQAGEQGVLVVDTGAAAMTDKVIAAIKAISKRPLRYVINTTHTPEHTGGNEKVAKTGEIIPFREVNYTAGPQGALDTKKASVISYLTVFHRLSAVTPATHEDGWPDNTFSTSQKRLSFNNEPVVIIHTPSTTDGDSLVLFRKSDVVSAGPLLDLSGYPRIDVKAGGSIKAVVDGLNFLIDTTVPVANAAGGTLVIPAHGRVADHAEVAYYRDMNSIVRDRVQDMIDRKMTLAQVKAARPTRDWDARYGKTTGAWTTDMYVEAVFNSLAK